MSATRETFSSRLGFILAAAGAAVGLGNIWGFPTQAAQNGGGAFVLMYLLMIAVVAFPMLVMELAIGRYGQANPVDAMAKLATTPMGKVAGRVVGCIGLSVPSAVLTFYSIVGGMLIALMFSALASIFHLNELSALLASNVLSVSLVCTGIFYLLTILIVQAGVKDGIERWSTRLMPMLFVLFGLMFIYILTLDGAMQGLKHYLIPDFSKIFDPKLMLAAMGQGFFSLTIGGCSMVIYGSYLSKKENLAAMGLSVTIVDSAVAFIAGLVIIPAMFVAMKQGVTIYDAQGQLIDSGALVFGVMPAMFTNLGAAGPYLAFIFFGLLIIAALTSSISMLEGPVALAAERTHFGRGVLSWFFGIVLALCSVGIIVSGGKVFDFVATAATQYLQPVSALLFCLFGAWVWHRNQRFAELKSGFPELEKSLFGRIWPWYVRFVCPVLVSLVLYSAITA
ncbi:hypothetical protein VST7929_02130 [Vibrio stylophorae]|uniref:Sodium-dependent transporter n=1 Tax=Vibrio stylophorae TaxID=659351 RepID=A0ABN8DW12_9VIBR|nr:sodium-dependent transporter [Vibrio stylophorae]CAH0534217.1 hypothetical protein VST7929_02130 [Vibrio stylophorae]